MLELNRYICLINLHPYSMPRIYLIIITLFCSIAINAQTLKGKISSSSGEPIPYSTIYIKETTSGIVADEQGKFQVKLNPGNYTCEFRCIGYQSQTKSINITAEGTEINVVLAEKSQQLNEVVVMRSKENPADRVMRQAIARAPFHLYQVTAFTAENYLKGSGKIDKVPGLIKMMISDKKLLSLIGKLLILESHSEVTFQTPSKYTQKVIAYKSSIPKEIEPKGGMRANTSSIYESNFMSEVSPLSPQAFRYYQFKLIDIFENGNYQVNKIQIIPKVKNGNLFSGFIYIIEGNWSVFSADLTTKEVGSTSRLKINYQEVKTGIFLPITQDINVDISTMGITGYFKYYSSTKYNSIKTNEAATVRSQPKTEKVPVKIIVKQKKTLEKIEKLSTKENLSNREAATLSKLMAESVEPEEVKERRKSLEIKDEEKVDLQVDSMADKRDSAYWENVRKVPLRPEESKSFKQRDSLQVSKNINTSNSSVTINLGTKGKLGNILTGGNFKLGKSVKLSYNGLLDGAMKEYNFADGLWLGQELALSINTNKTNNLTITPSAYYTTARRSVVWNVIGNYTYAPLNNGRLNIAVGNTSEDIQGKKGTSRMLNSDWSLFYGENVIRFYQKKYFSLENSVDIANGLELTLGAAYENRELLENRTSFHFFGKIPQPNYPDQAYRDAFPVHTATTAWLNLTYTPFYKYRIKEGKKEYVSSEYPTFSFGYKKAMPLLNQSEPQSSYDKMAFAIAQRIRLSIFDRLTYRVSFGTFLTKKQLFAPDLNYFATNPLILTTKSFENSFNLLDNYTSSSTSWAETHLNWTSDYLLLKRIPFLQPKLFDESLQLNMLWQSQLKNPYTEIGYSIGIRNLGRIGVFSGFDGLSYKSTGIKISFPLLTISFK